MYLNLTIIQENKLCEYDVTRIRGSVFRSSITLFIYSTLSPSILLEEFSTVSLLLRDRPTSCSTTSRNVRPAVRETTELLIQAVLIETIL